MRKRTQDDKLYARGRTGSRLRAGELYRRPCELCGASPAEAHHIDYADPDRVMWLCKAHHEQTHSQFGRPAPQDWMADIRAAVRRIEAQRIAGRDSERSARSKNEDQAWPEEGSDKT